MVGVSWTSPENSSLDRVMVKVADEPALID